jgi:hypothetical protein
MQVAVPSQRRPGDSLQAGTLSAVIGFLRILSSAFFRSPAAAFVQRAVD